MRTRCHALLVLSVLGAGAARAQDPSQAGAPFPDGPLMQAATQGGEQPGPPAGSDGQLAQPAQPGQQAQQTQQSPQQTADAAAAARRDALRLDHSGPYERFWFRGGPLLWWIKDAPAPSSRQENFFAHGLQMELEVRY